MSKPATTNKPRSRIAVLTQQIVIGSRELHLLPDGEFAPVDGRPMPWGTWKLTPEIADRVIAAAKRRKNDFVIDYEHQTQLAEKNGQPAPASGWWKDMEYRPGQGLYAVNVKWTTQAAKFIAAEEYRFSSAVFHHDDKTGEVLAMECAALTNTPGLDGLDDVRLATLRAHFEKADATPAANNQPGGTPSSQENQDMNPLLKALLAQLGLEEAATEAQANQAMAALKARAELADGLTTQIATLKAAPPDASKYVPLERYTELTTELATLKASTVGSEIDALIQQAKDAGKLIPAAEQVWRDVGKANLASLKALVSSTPANPALAGKSQTQGQDPTGQGGSGAATEGELAMCKAMGLTLAQFRAGADVA